MIEIFYKTIPFFALIGLGYLAAITRFFSAEATAYLTRFIFYFALSAMLFRFSSNLSLSELYDPEFKKNTYFLWLLPLLLFLIGGAIIFLSLIHISEPTRPY